MIGLYLTISTSCLDHGARTVYIVYALCIMYNTQELSQNYKNIALREYIRLR